MNTARGRKAMLKSERPGGPNVRSVAEWPARVLSARDAQHVFFDDQVVPIWREALSAPPFTHCRFVKLFELTVELELADRQETNRAIIVTGGQDLATIVDTRRKWNIDPAAR